PGDGAEDLAQRGCLVVEVGKDEGTPALDADRDQAEIGLAEVLGAVHLARNLEPAVEPVGPAVIRTLQAATVALREHHLGGAMAADVVEAAQRAVEIGRASCRERV